MNVHVGGQQITLNQATVLYDLGLIGMPVFRLGSDDVDTYWTESAQWPAENYAYHCAQCAADDAAVAEACL